jgi:hypothetical protein
VAAVTEEVGRFESVSAHQVEEVSMVSNEHKQLLKKGKKWVEKYVKASKQHRIALAKIVRGMGNPRALSQSLLRQEERARAKFEKALAEINRIRRKIRRGQ